MNQGNGLFNFDTNFTANPNSPAGTGDAMAGFLLGAYSSLSQDLQLVWAGYRVLEMGSYIADDWRVTSRLTLNLGLRYEFLPPPVEVGQPDDEPQQSDRQSDDRRLQYRPARGHHKRSTRCSRRASASHIN